MSMYARIFVPTRRILLLAAAVSCAGCASTYRPPDGTVAPRYGVEIDGGTIDSGATQEMPIGTAAAYPRRDAAADPWWCGFDDARLDRLVADVLERNRDLKTAALRVQRARLQVGQARNERLSVASGSLSQSDSAAIRGGGSDTDIATAQLSLSYEADLWRRLQAAESAAEWGAQASVEDLDSTALLLIANSCDLYWRLADINARIARGEDAIVNARRTAASIELQFQAGAVSRLEVTEAAQALQQRIGSQAQLMQQRSELRSAIAVLRGGLVWPVHDEPQTAAAPALPTTR